jgi:hypothetical protein
LLADRRGKIGIKALIDHLLMGGCKKIKSAMSHENASLPQRRWKAGLFQRRSRGPVKY